MSQNQTKNIKIAISAIGKDLDSDIDKTFARCAYFLIVDVDDNTVINTAFVENKINEQASGAGVSAAELVAAQKVEAVISSNIGPRAMDVLTQFGIKVYQASGNSNQAVNDFINNKLTEIK